MVAFDTASPPPPPFSRTCFNKIKKSWSVQWSAKSAHRGHCGSTDGGEGGLTFGSATGDNGQIAMSAFGSGHTRSLQLSSPTVHTARFQCSRVQRCVLAHHPPWAARVAKAMTL